MGLLDDLGLWLLLAPALGLFWVAALVDCARRPGRAFVGGASRRAWLWVLTLTGFLGAAAWFVLRPSPPRAPD